MPFQGQIDLCELDFRNSLLIASIGKYWFPSTTTQPLLSAISLPAQNAFAILISRFCTIGCGCGQKVSKVLSAKPEKAPDATFQMISNVCYNFGMNPRRTLSLAILIAALGIS